MLIGAMNVACFLVGFVVLVDHMMSRKTMVEKRGTMVLKKRWMADPSAAETRTPRR